MAAIKLIVYPTDFSDLSRHALDHAILLAERFDAALHCVHVLDDSYQYWMTLSAEAIPVAPPIEELAAAAEKELEQFVAEHVPAGLHAERTVLRGRPFIEIIRYAREVGADMIVMGTHGRSAIKQVLLGSVAEKVVRKAPCPVLTVRHPEHNFEMP